MSGAGVGGEDRVAEGGNKKWVELDSRATQKEIGLGTGQQK